MAGVCSTESDPRENVGAFVSDPNIKSITGTRADGLESLMNIIREEVLRQEPDTVIVWLDRDFMGEHKVLTSRELGNCLFDMTYGKKSAVFLDQYLPIIAWQEALPCLDENAQVYFGSLACGQVPLCVKLL